MKRITQENIDMGFRFGVVQLIIDPNMGSGTVCQIGEHWFYFGGMTAEEMSPAEYLRNVPRDDIIREICEALDGLETESPIEYLYYYYFLQEQHCDCGFCRIAYSPTAPDDFAREQRKEIAEGGNISLQRGINSDGRIYIFAVGEDYSDPYLPKFCPECGRKLCE